MKTSPAQIMDRLSGIEDDLAKLQDDLETSALTFYKSKRDYEYEYARERIKIKEKNPDKKLTTTDLDNQAIVNLHNSDSYKTLVISEANHEAAKLAYKVLDSRASIGQSLLRVHSVNA